jgi:hypothetical protein
MQFPQCCIAGQFITLDATLRKLPGVLADTFGPQQFSLIIKNDQANIGSVAIGVYHLYDQRYGL